MSSQSSISKCLNELMSLAEKQGYLTFDDILDSSNEHNLSVANLDKLNESLNLRGIIIYEEEPDEPFDSEEFTDYSQSDYDALYENILKIDSGYKKIIEYIKSVKPAQKKEITPLVMQAQEGNEFAKNRLIDVHMRAALKIAYNESMKKDLELGDAISAAFSGIQSGIEKFDYKSFGTIQSYIAMWVRQAIQRECKPKWIDFYFPAHMMEKIMYVIRMCDDKGYDLLLGEIPDKKTIQDIKSEHEDIEYDIVEIINHIQSQTINRYSLDGILDNWRHSSFRATVYDEVMGLSYDNLSEVIYHSLLKEELYKALNFLKSREKEVIEHRFGLIDGEEKTLEEVGAIFGVTRERIRQIESSAMSRLRTNRQVKGILAIFKKAI